MVSRNQNHLQRHIEESLAERSEMLEWIKRAQALSSFITVTERDWLRWGYLTPEEWLREQGYESEELELIYGFPADEWQEAWDDAEDDFEEPPFGLWEIYAYDEDYDRCIPNELEFGGRVYPAEHVQSAKEELSRPAGHGSRSVNLAPGEAGNVA